ncbi:methionyl-tRNA formyltransferase [Sulfurimonas sp.]|uniref:methionyl-tRNA formyltransferase n=1 Tax=Sulfurimonas sp. TaxID=2022749 RepID=UPI002AAFC9D3|nr:methionyl-tRNA formyltransferase [Sulfurimonas sp.]
MNIIFMGTPNYAKEILQKIIQTDEMNVVGVYTQPDKPVGRKKTLTAPVVKILAQENEIKVYQPIRLRDEEVVKELLNIECDYIVVAAYGQILPKEILDHAPCINLHASILPKYRGASPIQQSILSADKQTGVTAMLMDIGLDTGDILKIKKIDIDDDEMVESLFDRLTICAADLILEVLKNYKSYTPKQQNELKATHCKKITKKDGEISFDNASDLYNKYRAFTPWPAIYLSSALKLKHIELLEVHSVNEKGKILLIDKKSIVVGCEKGSIRIFKVQPASKKEMDILSYINGKRLNLADTLS